MEHCFKQSAVSDDGWVFGDASDFIADGFLGDDVAIRECFFHIFLNLLLFHLVRLRPLSTGPSNQFWSLDKLSYRVQAVRNLAKRAISSPLNLFLSKSRLTSFIR